MRYFGEIHEYDPKLFLVIAGPYSETNKLVLKLKKIIKKYNINKKVLFTGMLEGDIKWGAYYSSDFYCLPSHSENFGIVVAEALGCGVLIGISNKVNIYEEIENANAGLIFNDKSQLQVLGEWLKLNKEEKLNIRMNARSLFEKKYNFLNNTNKFLRKLKYYLQD